LARVEKEEKSWNCVFNYGTGAATALFGKKMEVQKRGIVYRGSRNVGGSAKEPSARRQKWIGGQLDAVMKAARRVFGPIMRTHNNGGRKEINITTFVGSEAAQSPESKT